MKVIEKIIDSPVSQVLVTLIIYSLYALVMGVSVAPSIYIIIKLFNNLINPFTSLDQIPTLFNILLFSLGIGGSIFVYFIWGSLFKASLIRVLSLGIKPGKYPPGSITMIRWLIYNGIYTLALKFILPAIPMSFLLNVFFQIIGCKMGKNVYLNTWQLNDPFLLTIGSNVVVGGQTDISCHTFKNGYLILKEITIGDNTLIGAHCYISPGVKIGKDCVLGLKTFVRDNKNIPDGTKWTNISMLKYRGAMEIENIYCN